MFLLSTELIDNTLSALTECPDLTSFDYYHRLSDSEKVEYKKAEQPRIDILTDFFDSQPEFNIFVLLRVVHELKHKDTMRTLATPSLINRFLYHTRQHRLAGWMDEEPIIDYSI